MVFWGKSIPESVNKYELTEEDLNAEYGGFGASPAYDEDAGPDYDEDAEYDPAEEEKLSRIMTADELRAEEPGISDEDIKLEQEEQQNQYADNNQYKPVVDYLQQYYLCQILLYQKCTY